MADKEKGLKIVGKTVDIHGNQIPKPPTVI